jgi:hypothetical protein
MKAWKLAVVLTLMGGALQAGCVEDVRFNPSGCSVHVRGRWLVDGQDPSQETCGNIALVELAIINEPEDEFWIPAEFSVRCDTEGDSNVTVIDGGAYIDTQIATRNRCGGGGEILREAPTDEYKSRWRGTTDLRFVVDCTPVVATPISDAADGGMLLDLGTVNLITQDGGAECPLP